MEDTAKQLKKFRAVLEKIDKCLNEMEDGTEVRDTILGLVYMACEVSMQYAPSQDEGIDYFYEIVDSVVDIISSKEELPEDAVITIE